MKAMKSLVRKENETLSEDSILVCVGNHLISNLAGKAVTSKTKSKLSCPCGCNKKLLAEEKMYIGKFLFFAQCARIRRAKYSRYVRVSGLTLPLAIVAICY